MPKWTTSPTLCLIPVNSLELNLHLRHNHQDLVRTCQCESITATGSTGLLTFGGFLFLSHLSDFFFSLFLSHPCFFLPHPFHAHHRLPCLPYAAYVSGTAAKVESGNYIEICCCQETQQCVALDTDTSQVL